jgi:UDP-N-acetylmuramate dehydrogenase
MAGIKSRVSLKEYNTFGIDASCDYFTEITSRDEFVALLKDPLYNKLQRLVIGGGSNILFTRDFHGLVIKNSLKGRSAKTGDNGKVEVTAAAGENWHEFVQWTLSQGLGGLENLSLIPGCVGASPMQNIGAYGVEIKDVFESLEAWSMEDGSVRTFSAAECKFGYRESVFKHELKDRFFIASVTFRLTTNPVVNTSYGAINAELEKMHIAQPTIRDVSNAVINIRRSKLPDPAVTGNAGSFFKNPEVPKTTYESLKAKFPEIVAYPLANGGYKLAAGWMIEQCGLKGLAHNGAAVHDRQALVLVNRSGCTGKDVYELSSIVRDRVREKFGVELEREVNIV